jgi:cytochrome c oxidase subunit 2
MEFRLFPPQASTLADQVDAVFIYLVAVSVFFIVLIFSLVAVFAVKYRRRSPDQAAEPVKDSKFLELLWTFVPLVLSLVMFGWGAKVFFDSRRVPEGALEVHVVAKQWMWKFQHLGGQREINHLHVPLGRAVKLIMTSEDVIHSLFFPEFRVKSDVLPGRYTQEWFEATRAGEYNLFCTQYCGTGHSSMVGRVTVMRPAEFESWLAGETSGGSLASEGEKLFGHFGCGGCHRSDALARAPTLVGVYKSPVLLTSGKTVTADEDYLRRSILDSTAEVVSGWEPIMPIFRGQLTESQVLQLIAYIKSLSAEGGAENR